MDLTVKNLRTIFQHMEKKYPDVDNIVLASLGIDNFNFYVHPRITIGILKAAMQNSTDNHVLADFYTTTTPEYFEDAKRVLILINKKDNKIYFTINSMGSHFTGEKHQKDLEVLGHYDNWTVNELRSDVVEAEASVENNVISDYYTPGGIKMDSDYEFLENIKSDEFFILKAIFKRVK